MGTKQQVPAPLDLTAIAHAAQAEAYKLIAAHLRAAMPELHVVEQEVSVEEELGMFRHEAIFIFDFKWAITDHVAIYHDGRGWVSIVSGVRKDHTHHNLLDEVVVLCKQIYNKRSSQ